MVRIAMTGRKGALLMSTVLTTFMSMLRCALWLSWSLWVVERYYSYYVQRTNERTNERTKDGGTTSGGGKSGGHVISRKSRPITRRGRIHCLFLTFRQLSYFAVSCTSNSLQPCLSFHPFDTPLLSPPLLAARLSSPYDMPPPPHNQNPNPSSPKNLSSKPRNRGRCLLGQRGLIQE